MKHRLTRMISLMLILCMLLPSALAETAAADGIITDLESLESSLTSVFALNDQLYVMNYKGEFYRQVEGGWVAAGACKRTENLRHAVEDGGKVWFLLKQEALGNTPGFFLLAQGAPDESGSIIVSESTVTVDLELDKDDYFYVNDFLVQDGTAYLLAYAPNGSDDNILYRIDTVTGECKETMKAPLHELANYKDGLLLGVRFNWQDEDDEGNTLMPQVVSVDPATGELARLGIMNDYNDGGVAYDPETDSVYFCDNSHVYRVAGDVPEIAGYLLPSNMGRQGSAATVYHGRYYVEDYRDASSASVDPSQAPAHILRVSDQAWFVDDAIREYAKLHPDIAIEYVEDYWNGLEEFTGIMQGEKAPDIFVESMSPDFVTLREKKYLVDLSSSRALTDIVSRMYPHLTKELLTDGKLYGLPISLEVYESSGYYKGAFEKAGVPLEEIPTTFDELFDFIVTWHDKYYEENEGMELFEYCFDARWSLFSMIYDAQMHAAARSGETLTFNTPTIRHLLTRLDELQPILDVVCPKSDDYDDYEYITNNALFTLDQCTPLAHTYPYSDDRAFPMPLALDENTPATIRPYMDVMCVNPYSQNVDAAIGLMEYVAQSFHITFLTDMMPDMNDPIENPDYDRNLSYWQEEFAAVEKQMAEASEDQLRDLKDRLDYVKECIESIEKGGRVGMSAEEIQWYREHISPALVLPTSQYMSSGSMEQMYSARQRYVDRQMSVDEFIQEIDRIVWMVQMENQ